jgi:hypothetical protein
VRLLRNHRLHDNRMFAANGDRAVGRTNPHGTGLAAWEEQRSDKMTGGHGCSVSREMARATFRLNGEKVDPLYQFAGFAIGRSIPH